MFVPSIIVTSVVKSSQNYSLHTTDLLSYGHKTYNAMARRLKQLLRR